MVIVDFNSLIVGIIAALTDKPKYYGASGWQIKATKDNREKVKLDDIDIQVLEMIRIGHIYLLI